MWIKIVFFNPSLMKYDWTFKLWLNFWIMGELSNYGWTFELWVNLWIMKYFITYWSTFELWVKVRIIGEYQLWLNILKWWFQKISWHRTFIMMCPYLFHLELWVNFWFMGEFLNYGWAFHLCLKSLIMGKYKLN